MYYNINIIFYFLFFLILSLIGPKKAFANTYFNDNFETSNLDQNWNFVSGGGNVENSWKVENGELKGEIGTDSYSYLYSKVGMGLDDYNFFVDAKNISGVDQSISFRVSNDYSSYYLINFRYPDSYWPQDNNNIKLYKFINGSYSLLKQLNYSDFGYKIDFSQGEYHAIKINLNLNQIKIFYDSELLMDINDNAAPLLTGGIGFVNWGGSYFFRKSVNNYDSIKITSLDDENTDIPKHKTIIIPGLGGSWNSRAMVYNEVVDNSDWRMTPLWIIMMI